MPIRKHRVRIDVDVFGQDDNMPTALIARVRSAIVSVMDKGRFLADMDDVRIDITTEITP